MNGLCAGLVDPNGFTFGDLGDSCAEGSLEVLTAMAKGFNFEYAENPPLAIKI